MVSSDQRRRQLAREKFERQQQRRAEKRRKARRRTAVIGAALAVVVAAGATAFATGAFDGKDEGRDDRADAADAPTPSKKPDPCGKPAPGQPAKLSFPKEPELDVDTSATYRMKLTTTCGDIELDLDAKNAPRTVNSFKFLADKGYFDHTKCHRLTTRGVYVLQCGDPTAAGTGTPGYKLPDENLKDPRVKGGTYPAGTVAMANTGPNTGGSQFFLVYKDSELAPNYTPFGTVKAGQDVLEKIAGAGESAGTGDGAPNATVVVDRATVTK